MAEAAYYFHWGVVQISLANFLVIAIMVVVFVAAIVLRLPRASDEKRQRPDETISDHDSH